MINLSEPSTPLPLNPAEVKRALVLIPHPDDEVIGCGGLLALLAQLGVVVRVVLVSDGSGAGGLPEGAAAIRFKEFLASLNTLGASISHEAWQLPDGGLADQSAVMDTLLAQSLVNFEPSLLIAPWLYDLHPDHAAVGQLALRRHQQFKLAQGVLFYEVWSPVAANRFLNITSVWPTKLAALQCHTTALECGNYVRAMQSLAAYRSLLSGSLAAEGEYAEAYFALDWAADSNKMGARYAIPDDGQLVSDLHQEVFASQVGLDWWQWKYAAKEFAGSVYEDQGKLVGFYGTLECTGLWQGKEVAAVQIADVMVASNYRFATRSNSTFTRVSSLIFNEHLGENKRSQLCFGFPAPRALKLGIRLGYYISAGKIFIAAKPVLKKVRLPLGVYKKCLPAKSIECFAWLNTLPLSSPPSQDFFSIIKGANYWQWRFAKHPEKAYQVIKVWRWGKLVAAAVVLPGVDGLELIDFALKDWQQLGLLQQVVENASVELGLNRFLIWGTQQLIESFSTIEQVHVADLAFASPGKAFKDDLREEIKGNCWFIGGDTDFR